ncbi:MAG: hypothetical protein PVG69_05605 [Desulfobacterales bacterium]|jgi:hypothetical protein
MNVIKTDFFGEVESIRLGYGPIGPPPMSVFMYVVDGLVIDNGKSKLKNKLQFMEDLYGRIRSFLQEGFSENAIIRKLDARNDRFAKWLALGNISFANMIRSAIHSTT